MDISWLMVGVKARIELPDSCDHAIGHHPEVNHAIGKVHSIYPSKVYGEHRCAVRFDFPVAVVRRPGMPDDRGYVHGGMFRPDELRPVGPHGQS